MLLLRTFAMEKNLYGQIFRSFFYIVNNLYTSYLNSLKCGFFSICVEYRQGCLRAVLMSLYRPSILSKLKYGCIVYRLACKFYIKLFDIIHHQFIKDYGSYLGGIQNVSNRECVRWCRRAFKWKTDVSSVTYSIKLKTYPANPA